MPDTIARAPTRVVAAGRLHCRMQDAPAIRAAIEAEVHEIVCEVLDLEPFELGWTDSFTEHHDLDLDPGADILRTLQCAFGVRIDPAEVPRMVNLTGVVEVLQSALATKHAAAQRQPA